MTKPAWEPGLPRGPELPAYLNALERQNAQLLAALEEVVELLEDADTDGVDEEQAVLLAHEYAVLWGWLAQARAAIAAVKGEG